MHKNNLTQLLLLFKEYCKNNKNKTDKAISQHVKIVKEFFKYYASLNNSGSADSISLDDIGTDHIGSVKPSDINAYISFCKNDLSDTNNEIARKSLCLKAFFDFLIYSGYIKNNPVKPVSTKLKASYKADTTEKQPHPSADAHNNEVPIPENVIEDFDYKALPVPVQSFLGYCTSVKNKSPKTVEEYRKDLTTFFRFYKVNKNLVGSDIPFEKISISDVDLRLIESVKITDLLIFMQYLAQERKNNAATRARKTSCLRSFYKYLNEYNFISVNPTENLHIPKIDKKLPHHLTLEQSVELLKSIDGPNKERDYCILTLFLNCGMRLQELVDINYNDIRNDGTIIIKGKGSKERLVYLNDACIKAINDYMAVRPKDGLKGDSRSALFISRNHNRINVSTVQKLVYKYLSNIGLSAQDGFSCHKLRHTAATLMYQTGNVDVRVLKELLGHENLSTTQIYTHVSDKQLKNASFSNPLSQISSDFDDNDKSEN